MKPVLLDTSAIVSLLDSTQQHHVATLEAISGIAAPLITCEVVIAESCYLLRRTKGAPEAILENLAAGIFQTPVALATCAKDVRRILSKYGNRETGLADAFLIHLANVFGTGDILTLDRDFQIYRWGRNNPFRLLIEG